MSRLRSPFVTACQQLLALAAVLAVLTPAARVVSLDGFSMEIVPEGRMLLTDHYDRPGIIGRIGTILGDHGINISRLSLSRIEKDRRAKAAVSIDGEVTDEVLALLQKSAGMERIRVIALSEDEASHTADLRPLDAS